MSVLLTEICLRKGGSVCPICLDELKPREPVYAHTNGGALHPIHKDCFLLQQASLLITSIFGSRVSIPSLICAVCSQTIDYTDITEVVSAVKEEVRTEGIRRMISYEVATLAEGILGFIAAGVAVGAVVVLIEKAVSLDLGEFKPVSVVIGILALSAFDVVRAGITRAKVRMLVKRAGLDVVLLAALVKVTFVAVNIGAILTVRRYLKS